MEKSWENFWTTGKVEDYLTYRNRVTDDERQDERKNAIVNGEQQQGVTKEIQVGKDVTMKVLNSYKGT